MEKAAQKAIEINPRNEGAYVSLGFKEFFYSWNFELSYQNFQKALEINPKSADVNLALSLNYIIEGDFENSLACIEKSREMDPLSTLISRTLADVYYFKEDYAMAIELYDWLIEQDPEFKAAVEFKAWSVLMNEKHDEAIALFESLGSNVIHAIQPFVQLGYAYALKGEMEVALDYLDKLKKEARSNPDKVYVFDFATLYSGLGMKDEAFEYLRLCLDERIGAMTFLNLSPIWKPLRSDPRFDLLLEEIGIKKIF